MNSTTKFRRNDKTLNRKEKRLNMHAFVMKVSKEMQDNRGKRKEGKKESRKEEKVAIVLTMNMKPVIRIERGL